MAQRVHLLCVERLHGLHRLHLQGVEADFHSQASSLRASFDSQMTQLRVQHAVALRELELVIVACDADELERVNEAKQQFETEREEVRNKNLESINELRIALESRIEELERAFDDHHRFYKETTDSASQHFRQLKTEDAQLSLSIFEKKRRVHKLSASLQLWRQKLQLNDKEGREKNTAIVQHKAHLQLQCDLLKQRMHSSRQRQHHRLLTLTQQAQLAIDTNRSTAQRAHHVLHLAHMTRSLTTEKERVTPHHHTQHTNGASLKQEERATSSAAAPYNPSAASQQPQEGGVAGVRAAWEEEKEQLLLQPRTSSLSAGGSERLPPSTGAASAALLPASSPPQPCAAASAAVAPLSSFFSAYNKVALDVLAMEAEKARLQRDNRQLRRQLQTFLDGLAITPNTIQHTNPLLIVNHRWSAAHTASSSSRASSAQPSGFEDEAAHTVRAQQPLRPPRLLQDGSQIVQQVQLHTRGVGAGRKRS